MTRAEIWVALVLAEALAFRAEEPAWIPGSTVKWQQLTGDFDRARGVATASLTASRAGVVGTDLGSSFEHRGRLCFLFGDTEGRPGDRDFLAWSDARTPDALTLGIPLAADGKFRPLEVPGIRAGAYEIPSHGISIGNRLFVIFTTDHTKAKTMGRSVLAVSDDDGATFRLAHDVSKNHFVNVSLSRADRATTPGLPSQRGVLLFGSGEYRRSSPRLACVPESEFGRAESLRYFAGLDGGSPTWSPAESKSIDLFSHPVVGEISVAWIPPLERWVMLYNSTEPRGIVMRTARAPWGPWSTATVIFDPRRDGGYTQFLHEPGRDAFSDPGRGERFGGEYGPFLIPRFTRGDADRCTIFFTMSTWNPYQVVLMSTDVEADVGRAASAAAKPRQARTTLPGGEGWTCAGDPPERFERGGAPHVTTFGNRGDAGQSVWHFALTAKPSTTLSFSVHGGDARVYLLRETSPLPSRIVDVHRFADALRRAEYGPVVEGIAGPRRNNVDIPMTWNLARHAGAKLRLLVVDDETDTWGFVNVSRFTIEEDGD